MRMQLVISYLDMSHAEFMNPSVAKQDFNILGFTWFRLKHEGRGISKKHCKGFGSRSKRRGYGFYPLSSTDYRPGSSCIL